MTLSSQLWPPLVDPSTLTWQINGSSSVRGLPGVGRALSLYGGLIGQMLIDQVKVDQILRPRPRILQQPDPDTTRINFVGGSVEEWFLDGNTASLVTARDSRGAPGSVKWFPAWAWGVPLNEPDSYYLHGAKVDARDVIHVKRGSDPMNPRRGIGVVEQHVNSLERAGLQEEYERKTLKEGGVPSVAVIAPQKDLTQKEVDDAGDAWAEKFYGPGRRAGIFPNGTKVETLSWSPSDQQLVLARQLTLTDLANIFNLDSYYLGAPASSHTYRTPGVMFVTMLRISLEPVLAEFEDAWGRAFLPWGSDLRFDRTQLTRDDMASMITMFVQAIREGIVTVDEARVYMGLTPFGTPEATTPRIPSTATAPQEDVPEPPPAIEVNPPKESEKS